MADVSFTNVSNGPAPLIAPHTARVRWSYQHWIWSTPNVTVKEPHIPIERSFSVVNRFPFFLFLLCLGCITELLHQLRDPTVVPLVRSKICFPPARITFLLAPQPGFPHDRCSSSSISNTPLKPSEFYKDCKSHISVEMNNCNLNTSVCNTILLNSPTSQTATCTSHFTNTRSCIVPTASHQTEKFQYLNP